jgi:hypothetical protein
MLPVQGAAGPHPSTPDDLPIYGGRPTDRKARIVVHDDWPSTPPITERELRVVEAFFVEIFDALLGEFR